MQTPSLPDNETERLQALRELAILDTGPEERFERLTRLARHLFGTPMALISLVDGQRQWFKSRQGLEACETGRDISFCGHAILSDETLYVPDARLDPRFSDNPLVTGAPHIRLYAGAPLRTAAGFRVGTLCIIDDQPRQLTAAELAALRDLADCVEDELEQIGMARQTQSLARLQRLNGAIARAQSRFILESDRRQAFDSLLNDMLELTGSEYGFIGEVLKSATGAPYLKSYSITNIAWSEEIRRFYEQNAPQGMEFFNLDTLFGAALRSGEVVFANAPAEDERRGGLPPGHPALDAFLGIPIRHGGELVAMAGLANRPGGYDETLLDFLHPLLITIGQLVTAARVQEQNRVSQKELARLSRVASQTTNGVVITGREGRVEWINEGFTRITGYTLEELRGRRPGDLLQGAMTDPATVASMSEALRQGGSFDVDIVNYTKDGRPFWLNISCNALRNSAGDLVGYMAIQSDISARKEAEEKIRATTQLLESILENVPNMIFLKRASDLRFEFFNRAGEALLGLGRDALLGRNDYDFFPKAQADAFTAKDREVLAAQGVTDIPEERIDTARGPRLLHTRKLALRDDQGQPRYLLGISEDISSRREAERELNRFKSTLDQTLDSVFMFDAATLLFIYVNEGAIRQVGYSREELLAMRPYDIKPYVSEAAFKERIAPLLAGRMAAITFETVHGHKSGRHIPVEIFLQYMTPQGDAAHFVAIVRDITERKRSEEALREQIRHTQAILDNMVDGIITIDEQGSIDSFNPAAERIFGYTPEEVMGRNVSMLMPNPYRDAHDGYLRNYQESGVARIIGIGREVEGLRQDGSRFPLELAVSEITRQGRRMYVGIVRDITERKRIEQMKSEFVSTVSHELRTPLTSISGALGLIAGGALGTLPDQARQMISIAHKNSLRLTFLINDLLDMEKLTAGKMHFDMKPQPLRPLIEQALESNRGYGVERRVTAVLSGEVPQLLVRIDSQRLLQVLSNLLSNAIKYSPEEGQVEVLAALQGERVRVTVRDHGPGIPPQFRDRIFQKFAQADSSDSRQKGGTGLGLAISRELVERMGGAIGFESVEGEGASFFFELPWQQEQRQSERAIETGSGRGRRILMVEHDPEVTRQLESFLARAGYKVEGVTSGAAALEALARDSYDAVTLELALPDINGVELIRRVRQWPDGGGRPFVVIAAQVEEGRRALDGDLAAIEWLIKPAAEADLLAALERLLSVSGEGGRRVLHVENDTDLHEVIRAMAGSRYDFELAPTLKAARVRLGQERFDVVILDITLPDGSGWELLPQIRERQPDARVVVLSVDNLEPEELKRVEGALLKSQVSPQQLLEMIGGGRSHGV